MDILESQIYHGKKYVLKYSDGDTFDSYEEYGDDDFEGTFSSYDDAIDAALDAVGSSRQGAETLHMSNPGDYEYDEENYEDPEYEVIQIEE